MLCCGQNSRSFGKQIAMWSSVLTRHCQAWIKCGKWRRVEDFCFIPYAHCCHCQLCWQSVATDSKESTGHTLFLFANPFSLHFGIDCHDSIGWSVLTTAKVNTRLRESMVGTKHSGKEAFLQSHSYKWKWTSRGELILSVVICGDEKTHAWSWALNWLMHFCVCVV